jgi:tetratricopeptide (TPR) repeat protein
MELCEGGVRPSSHLPPMLLPRLDIFKVAAVTAAFVCTLLVLTLVNRSPSPAPGAPEGAATSARSTEERVRSLQAAIREHPERAALYSLLGEAYLQRSRETGDPTFYSRAEGVLRRALARDPRDAAALTGMGALAAARHDFRTALDYGQRARRLAPQATRPYGVVVDALVELGRYDEAAAALQRMVDLKPDLASYARVSYFRELEGDLDGAVEAMRLAASASGGASENVAYVQTLLGNLEQARGRHEAARRAYALALDRFPGYVPAEVGRAQLAAAKGRLGAAIRRYKSVVARLPLPEHVIALGEAELAAGRVADASRDFELVQVEQRLLAANGVNTDVELALFESEHGDARRGLRLARRAWASAPSVRSADALGWALTRAGRPTAGLGFAKRAIRLGSRDPLFLYHAGVSAKLAGRVGEARSFLVRARTPNPRFSPLHGPRAARALRSVR